MSNGRMLQKELRCDYAKDFLLLSSKLLLKVEFPCL